MYKLFGKRVLDIILSLLALVVLSPLILVFCLLSYFFMGKPIFLRQTRLGKNEKDFDMLKFRTMTNDRDENGNLMPDEVRLTKFGIFMRKTSIDELPELINILKGDMSIIGPRPLFRFYLPYYSDREKLRHTVRGGIIPPEVLHNVVTPTWDEQLEYEADYAEKLSFIYDLKILFATPLVLLRRDTEGFGEYVRESLSSEREKVLNK